MFKSIMVKQIHFIVIIFILTSCSFLKNNIELNNFVLINSVPVNAEVFSDTGVLIGVTPLKLDIDKLNLYQKDSVLSLSLRKLNYQDKQVIFKNLGVSEINVKLSQVTEPMAKVLIAGPLSLYINSILKKTIKIQDGIITKNIIESKTSLETLINDYPNVASLYVLLAAIEIQNKNYSVAKVTLEKSIMLDGSDELARSYLNFVNKRLNNEQ
jgi:hypothetical protein